MSIESELHDLREAVLGLTAAITDYTKARREAFFQTPAEPQDAAPKSPAPAPEAPAPATAAANDAPAVPTKEQALGLARQLLTAGRRDDLQRLLETRMSGTPVTALSEPQRVVFVAEVSRLLAEAA